MQCANGEAYFWCVSFLFIISPRVSASRLSASVRLGGVVVVSARS